MRHKTEELKLCQSKRFIDGFLDIFVAFWFRPKIEEFADNLQLSLDKISNQNPFLTFFLSDFKTKSSTWYKHNKTT